MRTALIFGASGQIGRPLLPRLLAAGWQVVAVSRHAHTDRDGLRWLRGDLSNVEALPAQCDLIVSCGPLDHFSDWYARSVLVCPRVIAFGSTSVAIKHDSTEASERDVAKRLGEAEDLLLEVANARTTCTTILRPTLIYGGAGDRTLTRIASIAGRWRHFALPTNAIGIRQPVHVDDLAKAAFDAIDAVATCGQVYALPGGERLSYRAMVERVLSTQTPQAKLHLLPPTLFAGLLACARVVGVAQGFGDGALSRMRDDLEFDDSAARRDFGYAPRSFQPTAAMFRQ